MRLFSSIIAGLATFAFAATASAGLNIDVQSDLDTLALAPGDEFTLTITLTTDFASEAQGLTLRAAGWAPGDLSFVSATIPNIGAASPNGAIFALDVGGGLFINGINNILTGPEDNGTNVALFNGVATGATTGSGPEVFTLTLAYAGGAGTITVGAIESFGDAFVSNVDGTTRPTTTIAYAPVPEPGTALLIGLGLAGLATAGRRE